MSNEPIKINQFFLPYWTFYGHFAEKNGTRTDIHGHWLKKIGKFGEAVLSLPLKKKIWRECHARSCTTFGYG